MVLFKLLLKVLKKLTLITKKNATLLHFYIIKLKTIKSN